MHPNTGDNFTDRERLALASGLARIHRGRVIPIIRGAEGDDPPADPPQDPPADPPADPERTFSQADVDRVVRDRLARQKAQFADYDALKDRASKLDELEEAQKTELQKAHDRAAELEKQATDAAARAQEALLRSAVVAEAARKNVVDPDAAVALIDRATLEFGEDGAPTNVTDVMDALLKAKPYLLGGRSTGSADLGARTGAVEGQLTREHLKSMTPEQIVAARKEGRLDSVMRGDS